MSTDDTQNRKQTQEKQYAYPYHYIPYGLDGQFQQTQYWSWGFRYLGGLRTALDLIQPINPDSLLDVGCGDGRFLREVASRYPQARLMGLDYSERAIGLARGLNPDLSFAVHDLTQDSCPGKFQVATLIEVLEHIPPDDLSGFLVNLVDCLAPNGWIVCTVPHTNKMLSSKHFQHFNAAKLRTILEPYAGDFEVRFIDSRSHLLRWIQTLLGGSGNHFVITNPWLMQAFFRMYVSRYLYTREADCGRIAVRCRLLGNNAD